MKITLQDFSINLGGGVCFSCALPKGHYKHFKKKFSAIFAGLVVCSTFYMAMPQLEAAPRGFVNIKDISDSIQVDMAYVGRKNFLGRRVAGYEANKCYLKEEAAVALERANQILQAQNKLIIVRDCWRPTQASFDMSRWADAQDQRNLKKNDLSSTQQIIFEDTRLFDSLGFLKTSRLKRLDYLATYSNHNKGGTVDIELLEWASYRWKKADTGTDFDVFSPRSAMNARVNETARSNRNLIAGAMKSSGFRGLYSEWWHWTHRASNSGDYLDGTVD
ncbi:MAG: M15 family metallopeptidase [Bdellovibrionota bacterium]